MFFDLALSGTFRAMSTLPPILIPSGSRLACDAQTSISFPALDAIRGVIDARDNFFCEGILSRCLGLEQVKKEREKCRRIDNVSPWRWYVTPGPNYSESRPTCGWCYRFPRCRLIPQTAGIIKEEGNGKKHTLPISRNRLCARSSLVASIIPRSASVWCRRASMASM